MKSLTIIAAFVAALGLSSAAFAGNKATIVQSGGVNVGNLTQNDPSNRAFGTIVQRGYNNSASAVQTGRNANIGIGQTGHYNNSYVFQMP